MGAPTSTAICMSVILLGVCRWHVDGEMAFVHSLLPLHRSQPGYVHSDTVLPEITTIPVLSSLECDQFVAAAEAYDGWTTKRHGRYATTDIPLQVLPQLYARFDTIFTWRILPQVPGMFGARWPTGSVIRPMDFFVVKYSAEESQQRHLDLHRDGGQWSFIIALNQHETDYTGGGTKYHLNLTRNQHQANEVQAARGHQGPGSTSESSSSQPLGSMAKSTMLHMSPPKGSMVSHPTWFFHEGVAIDSGTRYLLTGFTQVDTTWNDFVWWLPCYLVCRAACQLLTMNRHAPNKGKVD
eukprot:TRINITY_DN50238_c0_g1_i1.p1 TRINITY_DN50238_c0_g1~~TRINITY_DN50238_c0_g1_i1.p1  ORF type:complete len:296 (-),score=29.50 TRINITY_DN50238_c0_g1_i1:233-1120(-)